MFNHADSIQIDYNGYNVVLADKFPVNNGDTLLISVEKTNSEYKQGFSIDISGSCEYKGTLYKQKKGVKMLFWEDTTPKKFELVIYSRQNYVWIQNFWEAKNDMGTAFLDRAHNGAAMIVEEIENGRRYRCNDITPDDDFDDIIFTVCYAKPEKNMSETPC
ncbi:MAG: hypothetical protein KDK44_00475 [Chlamydiia bacterium]|nr:hypothetical protein [Chlamydiia bacterium]